MFPSPYLNHILDDAHQADLRRQITARPLIERHVVKNGRAALVRLLRHDARSR
jgi:hypothetical protein